MVIAAYFNIHGDPVGVSARDAVLKIEPSAWCKKRNPMWARGASLWSIYRTPRSTTAIGQGASEESAWLNAWSRMLAESMKSEKRG